MYEASGSGDPDLRMMCIMVSEDNPTIRLSLQQAVQRLQAVSERPRLEAEILLAYHLNKDRTWLMTHDDMVVEDAAGYEALVDRRAEHEPIEYITGRVSFYDIELFIAPGALIPRPETEILVEKAAELIRKNALKQIAEIGVGSGAVSVVLARIFPDLQIVASDVSEDALAIAQHNIEAFGLTDRITLYHSSLLEGIDTPIEMIVSNPPYIAREVLLEPNVQDFEPHTALFADGEGDALLKEIICLGAKKNIRHIACEMGYDQRESISAFVKELGVYSVEFYTDLAGLDRGFVLSEEVGSRK